MIGCTTAELDVFNRLLQWVCNAQTGFGPYWGHRQCDAACPTTRLMLLHFVEVVQWGTGCSNSGGLQSWWWGGGNILFVFLRFFLKFVFSSSFVGCLRDRTGWLVSQQVSYKITAGSCDCVLLSETFLNRAFNVFHTGLRTIVVASARHCFSIQSGGKRHLFFSSSLH